MSFLTNLRADRLIADIKAAGGSGDADPSKALEKLSKLGASAIPRIVDALATADRQETAGFVNVLASLIDNKSLPIVITGLSEGNQRASSAIVAALSAARG